MTDNTNDQTKETKAEKFRRLGNARLNKAVEAIRALEPLSEINSYEYSQAQEDLINDVLLEAVDRVRTAFKNGGVSNYSEYL